MYSFLSERIDGKTFETVLDFKKAKGAILRKMDVRIPSPYSDYFDDIDYLIQNEWFSLNVPKRGGKLIKRLKKYAREKALKWKFGEERLQLLKDYKWDVLGEEITRILSTSRYTLELSSDLDHRPGEFSDYGSCFWGSYESARFWMMSIGARKLIIQSEDGIRGRAWVLSVEDVNINHANVNYDTSFVIVNVYHPKVTLEHLRDAFREAGLNAKIIDGKGYGYYVNDDRVLFVSTSSESYFPDSVSIQCDEYETEDEEYYEEEEEYYEDNNEYQPEEEHEESHCVACGNRTHNLINGLCQGCVCPGCHNATWWEHRVSLECEQFFFLESQNQNGNVMFTWRERRNEHGFLYTCHATDMTDVYLRVAVDYNAPTDNGTYRAVVVLETVESFRYPWELHHTVALYDMGGEAVLQHTVRDYLIALTENNEALARQLRLQAEELLAKDVMEMKP